MDPEAVDPEAVDLEAADLEAADPEAADLDARLMLLRLTKGESMVFDSSVSLSVCDLWLLVSLFEEMLPGCCRIYHYPTRSPMLSGQEPQIIARLGNLPLSGARTRSFFFFSSTSATYTNPITLASRMFSCESFGSACTIARMPFCMAEDG